MIDPAHAATDDLLEEIEHKIARIYGRAADEIEKSASKFWRDFDKEDRKWFKKVKADPSAEAQWKQWRREQLMTGERFDPLREEVCAHIANARKEALAYVNGQLPRVYTLNYNHVGSSLYEGLAGYSFSLMDAPTVQRLALTNSRLLPYRIADGQKLERWAQKTIREELTQGIIQGDSIPHIAKRFSRVAKMDGVTATRTARTMVTSAENGGRMDALKKAEDDGIQLVKKWIATKDDRTREAHEELDGEEVGMDEPFVNSIGPIACDPPLQFCLAASNE